MDYAVNHPLILYLCHLNDELLMYKWYLVTTDDSQIEEGSRFAIRCRLNSLTAEIRKSNRYVNSSMIRFEFEGKHLTGQNVETIDEKTLQINLPSAQISDSGFYYCYLDVPDDDDILICNMHLNVARMFIQTTSFDH